MQINEWDHHTKRREHRHSSPGIDRFENDDPSSCQDDILDDIKASGYPNTLDDMLLNYQVIVVLLNIGLQFCVQGRKILARLLEMVENSLENFQDIGQLSIHRGEGVSNLISSKADMFPGDALGSRHITKVGLCTRIE